MEMEEEEEFTFILKKPPHITSQLVKEPIS
jgi:hypothetical protein